MRTTPSLATPSDNGSGDALTDYGFRWGPIEVERCASIERRKGAGESRVLRIKIGDHNLNVYVSPTGRSVRVFRDGQELSTGTRT